MTTLNNGDQFTFLTTDGEVSGGSRTQIVAHFVPGYPNLDAENVSKRDIAEAAYARHISLQDLSIILNEAALSTVVADGEANIGDFTEDEINWLLPSEQAVGLVFTGTWDNSHLPITLVRTNYAPFTARPVPSGNVTFLDPSSETTYLDSLVKCGFGELFIKDGVSAA